MLPFGSLSGSRRHYTARGTAPFKAPQPYNLGVVRWLVRRAWIGALVGIALVLLPNSWLRALAPVSGPLPTMTPQTAVDTWSAEFEAAVNLAASDPLAALSTFEELMFLDFPQAESARTVAGAIQSGRLADNEAYLLTATGQGLAAIAQWRAARAAFLRAVELNPEYAEAWAYLGEAQYQTNENASAALQRALELDPNSLAVQLFNALYWQRQGDFAQASLHFRVASKLDPENPAILIQWGQNAMLGGDPLEARQHFEAAAELTPNDPLVQVAVAEYSLNSELFVEELGYPAALALVENFPDDPQALTLLGRAHLLLGYKTAGRGFLERALQIDPGYAPAHLYLGIYLLSREETEASLVHLNEVIALLPGSVEAARAADLIVQYSH